MATATRTKSTKATKAVEPEAVAEEVLDDELEELEESEATDAPAKGSATPAVTFGASDLAKHLSEGREKPVSAREIRTLLRKMARDGRINREITPGNRTRYDWSGPNDPEVQKVIEAFNAGELDADKAEKLQALKDRKAAQKAEKDAAAEAAPAAKKSTKAKAAPAPVEEDDEELELED